MLLHVAVVLHFQAGWCLILCNCKICSVDGYLTFFPFLAIMHTAAAHILVQSYAYLCVFVKRIARRENASFVGKLIFSISR